MNELEQALADVETGRIERESFIRCLRVSVGREGSSFMERAAGADLVCGLWLDWRSRRHPVQSAHLDRMGIAVDDAWTSATQNSLDVVGQRLQVLEIAPGIKTDSWIGDSAPVAMLFLRDHPKPALAVVMSTEAVCSVSPRDRETASRAAALMLHGAVSRRTAGKPVSDGLYWAGQGSIRRLDVKLRRSWLGRPQGLDDRDGEFERLFS